MKPLRAKLRVKRKFSNSHVGVRVPLDYIHSVEELKIKYLASILIQYMSMPRDKYRNPQHSEEVCEQKRELVLPKMKL